MEVDVNPVVSYPQVTAQSFSIPQAVNPSQSEVRITEELQQMGMRSEWVIGTALKKPYPGAPNLPVTTGFNMGNKGQEAQARIPQFFNFIGSRTDDAQAARRIRVNVTASLSRIPNSVPEKYPETQCEPGYYICPFDGTKKMTSDNPLALEIERKELQKALEESARLNSTIEEESSTVSPEEAARIRAEVQAVMKQQFAKARANVLAHAKLESNPVASCKDSVYSGTATANPEVIDLITQSVASLQKLPAYRTPWVANIACKYLQKYRECNGIFSSFIRSSLLPSPSNVCINAVEAQRATVCGALSTLKLRLNLCCRFLRMSGECAQTYRTCTKTRQRTATTHRITEGAETEVRRHTNTCSSAAGDGNHQPQ